MSESDGSRQSVDSVIHPGEIGPFVNEQIAYGPAPLTVKNNFRKMLAMLKGFYRSKNKNLCHRCRSIDWAEICQLTNDKPYTHYRLFKRKAEWMDSKFACVLCQLMYDFDNAADDLLALPTPSLFFDSVYMARERKGVGDSKLPLGTVIAPTHAVVHVLGILHPNKTKENYTPRLINHMAVDYGMVRGWIDHCSSAHTTDKCVSSNAENLSGFKVIDCRSKKTIPAPPHCVYVALSYVWGKPQLKKEFYQNNFPLTIEDSVQVCLSLGYDYLWVDQYCIDQSNADERHSQIAKMDQIYQEATLTIIALDGENSESGLPGVSISRYSQGHVNNGDYTILTFYPYSQVTLRTSEWAKRAWTYQEGFLSKRKLIFSHRQVYFVCGESYFAESFAGEVPLSATHSKLDFSRFFSTNSNQNRQGVLKTAHYCVQEYSTREMTYESDSLNACLGVLRSFTTDPILGHLWGVFVSNASAPRVNLAWRHRTPTHRRANFPSWSWAGWKGEISHAFLRRPEDSLAEPLVDICLLDQRTMSMQEYINNGLLRSQSGDPDAPRILRLTGYLIKFRLVVREAAVVQKTLAKRPWTSEETPYVICQVTRNRYRSAHLHLDYDMPLDELDHCISMAIDMILGIYIVLKPTDGMFARVGLIWFLNSTPPDSDQLCYEDGSPLEQNDWESLDYYTAIREWVKDSTPQSVFVA